MPAVAGGATEKSWTQLAEVFAAQGHEVTIISRRWPGLPDAESNGSVRHVRLPGQNHSAALWVNLIRDFWWSLRVFRNLPEADVVVVNAVTLPIWLSRLSRRAGKVVIMTGRVPKGQYRAYGPVALAVAASSPVLAKVAQENTRIGSVGSVYGYPIDFPTMYQPLPRQSTGVIRIGYVGRLHREKGIETLIGALTDLSRREDLPPWKAVFCGPIEISQGGSGRDYVEDQINRLGERIGNDGFELIEPKFDAEALAEVYQSIDIFVLPSESEDGETFGVAAIEAMAAGCAVITSSLECFSDYLHPGENGSRFDHRSENREKLLSDSIAQLVADSDLRSTLAAKGQQTARNYDFAIYGQRLLGDFNRIIADPS